MDGSDGRGDDVGVLNGDALVEWVKESCAEQGVPFKVTDVRVVDRVRTLLTGAPGGPGRGVSPDGRPGALSQAPDGLHPLGVEGSGTRLAREDHGVVENRFDDCELAVEIEGGPLSA